MSHPAWWWRVLTVGDTGADVSALQRMLLAPVTGVVDEDTRARVRGVQRVNGLPLSGDCDVDTANAIGELSTFGLPPAWWPDLVDEVLPVKLRCRPDGLPDAVRRFQSTHRIPPTGVVDERTAIAMGD